MTTLEVATLLKITVRRVVKIIEQGDLAAVKHGRDWWIEESEVERYQQERRGPGKPKKGE